MACIVLLALLLLPMPAQAQFYGGTAGSQSFSAVPATNYGASFITYTNWPLSPATNMTAAPLVAAYNSRYVGLYIRTAGQTNTSTFTTGWARGNGSFCETNPYVVLSLAAPVGVTMTLFTNIDLGGFQFLYLMGATNSSPATNNVVGYSLKPGF